MVGTLTYYWMKEMHHSSWALSAGPFVVVNSSNDQQRLFARKGVLLAAAVRDKLANKCNWLTLCTYSLLMCMKTDRQFESRTTVHRPTDTSKRPRVTVKQSNLKRRKHVRSTPRLLSHRSADSLYFLNVVSFPKTKKTGDRTEFEVGAFRWSCAYLHFDVIR